MRQHKVCRHDFEQFLATTLAEREQRYRKHGASPYIGEPNVKESAGGLRDMHTAMWLRAGEVRAPTPREATGKGLLTPREHAAGRAPPEVLLAGPHHAPLFFAPQKESPPS